MAKNQIRRCLGAILDPLPKRKEINAVWEHFKSECAYCGLTLRRDLKTAHLDHILSQSNGGTNDIHNFVLSCATCNGDHKRDQQWDTYLSGMNTDARVLNARRERILAWTGVNPLSGNTRSTQAKAAAGSIIANALSSFEDSVMAMRELKISKSESDQRLRQCAYHFESNLLRPETSSMNIPPDHCIGDSLLTDPDQILHSAQSMIKDCRADVAVAFWGIHAANAVGLNLAASGSRVLLNADSGACNPNELAHLRTFKNVEVRNVGRLHAKLIVGTKKLLVGSANMSSNGLGYEGSEASGWSEACLISTEQRTVADAKKWFDALWSKGEPLSDEVIERARRARLTLHRHWMAVARHRQSEPLDFDALGTAPIYVVVTDDEIDSGTRADFSKAAQQLKLDEKTVDFYQDWKEMPSDALLFGYQFDPKKNVVEWDGAWDTRRSHTFRARNRAIGHSVLWARSKTLRDFGSPTAKLNWKKSVMGLIEHLRDKRLLKEVKKRPGVQCKSATDWCIPLYDFIDLCRTRSVSVPSHWA
jgi:hypothetical protein